MSDYVSEDSFLLIFKSLPVKTLLRFRCVCKWWKGLIDSHSFVQDHLAVQKARFIVDYEVPNEFLVLDPRTLPLVDTLSGLIRAEPEQNLRLLGTLHGVVCLSANNSEYLLWNPSIRKFSIIPLPEAIEVEMFDDVEEAYSYTLSSFFEWDNREIATFSGFWIDPSTKDFKIITFKLMRINEGCETPLNGIFYSSIEQDWMQISKLDPSFYNCRPMPGSPPVLMVGDVAYWRARVEKVVIEFDEDEEEEEEHEKAAILWFDFVKEKFGYIRVPNKDYSGGEFQPVHCRLQGGLSLVYWDSGYPFRCDIYSRKDDTWVQIYDLLLSPTAFHVFCVLEEMEARWRGLAIDQKAFVLYDTKEGSMTLRSGIESPVIYIVNDFVESLLFP